MGWYDEQLAAGELEESDEPRQQGITPGKLQRGDWSMFPRVRRPGKVTLTSHLPAQIARAETTAGRPSPAKPTEAVRHALGEQGQPLADAASWSEKVGADVTGARVVTGPTAAKAAASIEAKAFTLGNRVFLGGRHSPNDSSLMRHELTHVAQQQGASLPSFDSLKIAGVDSHAEVEARSNSGATEGSSAATIARDEERFDVTEYIDAHQQRIFTSIANRMRFRPVNTGSAAATWRGEAPVMFMNALTAEIGGNGHGDLAALRTYLAPDVLEHLVDRGRDHQVVMMAPEGHPEQAAPVETNDGHVQWYEAVGVEVSNALSRRLNSEMPKVMPRYIDARAAARAAYRAEHQRCDEADLPQPNPADIVPRHPLDRVIAKVLCEHECVTVDWENVTPVADEGQTCRIVDFEFLHDQGMEYWFRVTPADATPEEVAQALFEDTAQAFRLQGAAPLYAISDPTGVVDQYVHNFTDAEGFHRVGVDNVGQLLDSELADEAALGQADPGHATGADAHLILRNMRDCVRLFDICIESAAVFGLHGLDGERERVDQRSQELAAGFEGAVYNWDAHAAQQKELLQAAANGLVNAKTQLESMTDLEEDSGGFHLPTYTRRILRGLAEAYRNVARASHLPQIAQPLKEEADQRSRMYPIDLMEGVMRTIQHSLTQSQDSESEAYEVGVIQSRERRLRERLGELRAQMLADPESTGPLLRELQEELNELQTQTQITTNMDAMHNAFTVLDSSNTFWMAFWPDDLDELEAEGRGYYQRWLEIKRTYDAGNHDEARTQLDALKQDSDFASYLSRVHDELDDARIITAIAQLATMLAITLVTMGVGAYVTGAATAAGWSAGAVGLASTTAEAATFTALSTALFTDNPTVAGVAGEFVFNFATFGALRVVSGMLNAAGLARVVESGAAVDATRGARLAGGAAAAGEMSVHAFVLGFAGWARDRVERELDGRPPMSDEEMEHFIFESLAMFVVITIIGRMAREPFLEPLQRAGGRLGAKIRLANQRRIALANFGDSLGERPTLDQARELIRSERAELQAEEEALRELQREAEDNPEVLAEAGMTAEELGGRLERLSGRSAEVESMANLMALEAIGPGHYAAPRERLPWILNEHQSRGGRVSQTGVDPVTNERTFEIEYPDGQKLRLTERIPEGAGQDVAAPSGEEVAQNEAEIERILQVEEAQRRAMMELGDGMDYMVTRHLTGGGGLAAVLGNAARGGGLPPGTMPTDVSGSVAIGGPEPWRVRADRLRAAARRSGRGDALLEGGTIGQNTDNWSSTGLTHQPGSYNTGHGQEGQFGRASDIANAITATAFETGFVAYDGYIVSIEAQPTEGGTDWLAPDRPWRATVIRGETSSRAGEQFHVYFETASLSTGLGPANSLSTEATARVGETAQITQENLSTLLGDQRIVYFDQHYGNPSGGRVLVMGSGPSAVWNAQIATEVGARVTVLGRANDSAVRTEQSRTRGEIEADLSSGRLTEDRAEFLLNELEGAISPGRTVRNEAIYNNPNIEFRMGTIEDVRPSDPTQGEPANKVMVRFAGETQYRPFDQLAIAIGQNVSGGVGPDGGMAPQGPPGVGHMINGIDGAQLSMVRVRGRLVALEVVVDGQPTGIQIEGGNMTRHMAPYLVDSQRATYLALVEQQANATSVPEQSRGVEGSIYQVGQNVPLANTRANNLTNTSAERTESVRPYTLMDEEAEGYEPGHPPHGHEDDEDEYGICEPYEPDYQ